MKHAPLLLALALLSACTKERNTAPLSAAEIAVNKAVGTYPCRAYFTQWSGGSAATTSRLRDTTLVVSRVDTNTVQIGAVTLDIYRTPNNQTWRGHAPARSATSFGSPSYGISTTYKLLQVDQSSDSIYFEDSGSGHSFGRVWKYYGKK